MVREDEAGDLLRVFLSSLVARIPASESRHYAAPPAHRFSLLRVQVAPQKLRDNPESVH
jgi:hypothetical protein